MQFLISEEKTKPTIERPYAETRSCPISHGSYYWNHEYKNIVRDLTSASRELVAKNGNVEVTQKLYLNQCKQILADWYGVRMRLPGERWYGEFDRVPDDDATIRAVYLLNKIAERRLAIRDEYVDLF